MKRLALGPVIVAALAGLGCPGPTEVNVPTKPSASAERGVKLEEGPLSVTLRASIAPAKAGEKPAPNLDAVRTLRKNDEARSGEYFAYYVKPDQDAYVYVLQFFPDGTAAVIFPREGDEKIPGGEESRVPTSDSAWLRLDSSVGEEHLYVIASPRPLAELDQKAAQTIDDVRTSPQAGANPAPVASFAPPRENAHGIQPLASAQPSPQPSAAPSFAPPPPPTQIIPPFRPPKPDDTMLVMRGGFDQRARAVELVEVEEGYRAKAGANGVVVIHFPFQHK